MRTITQLDIDMPRYCCARPIAVSFPHRREYKMSYRSNRVRQMYPIAVRSQDDRPRSVVSRSQTVTLAVTVWLRETTRSVRTTFVGGPFFSWADRFFQKKKVRPDQFSLKNWS